ncbi:hypothetical protein L914_16329 [Phytophthora nicotianae]|uniref:MULE transposase domain-containing protein n=1 Tax=Phytophthora nicotianae TaxID=4792 RepID=W2MLA4_PHYNI|nr:hypothetical protein L914_16329 [Phytophthora nicotianae]
MRTIHALSRKFGTPLKDVVPLKTIQNFVNNYSRICRENHDRMDKLSAWVHKRAYTGLEAMTESFTFGWQIDNAGKSVRGNGSDDKPFIVELSTKALVLRLMTALSALRRLCYWVTAKELKVNYAMADGDQAQCNARAAVSGDIPAYRFLMCFFHVMKKRLGAR